MIKRLLIPIVFILLVFAGLGGYLWFNQNILPVSKSLENKQFLITKGSGAMKIANNLEREGLIQNALVFKIYTKITGTEGRIQPGQYELSPSLSMIKVISELLRGPRQVWVTIPEGLRREEIADKFVTSFSLKDQKALDFKVEFLSLTKDKEGYLFPDTYLFEKTTSAQKVVTKLSSTFDLKTKDFSPSQKQVIIASLLERETSSEEEKPVVAGIILKRLKTGWPLQIDASVQYAVASSKLKSTVKLDNYWEKLTKADIDINSPFNTYAHPGLPPSPIASPGLSSIKAAISPEESEYWYYIHDSKGKIHFARTLEEHNENIRKYL